MNTVDYRLFRRPLRTRIVPSRSTKTVSPRIVGYISISSWLLAITILGSINQASAGGGLYICAAHSSADTWADEFRSGAIAVPPGTVFDYAGHILGNGLSDPKGQADYFKLPISEVERRNSLLVFDLGIDRRHTKGIITTEQVTLTESKPCALASAMMVRSSQWGWTILHTDEDNEAYYTAYGAIRRGVLNTDFANDQSSFDRSARVGAINGSVRGSIYQVFDLDADIASQPPDEMPVDGEGNAECWGDSTRQDVTCRALTEKLLMSLRFATKDQILKAMNVAGRQLNGALQFVSNYSRGQRWGAGLVTFRIRPDGKVSLIDACIEPPNGYVGGARLLWNAELLPDACSDLPNTLLQHCVLGCL